MHIIITGTKQEMLDFIQQHEEAIKAESHILQCSPHEALRKAVEENILTIFKTHPNTTITIME